MNQLNKVETADQVYSQELNQILLKTPPGLFRLALIIFSTCLTIVMIGSIFMEYEKEKQYQYVAYEQEDGKVQLVLFADEDITNYLEESSLQLQHGGGEWQINADSVYTSTVYKINNEFIRLDEPSIQALNDLSKIEKKYKYQVVTHQQQLQEQLVQNQAGVLSFAVGKVRLYRLFFS
jgi:hypothetical protein